jgi:RNA-directed DNA polymerase
VAFLGDARKQLKTGAFTPLPVRERMIPKAGQPGKLRRLGIPTESANCSFAQGS